MGSCGMDKEKKKKKKGKERKEQEKREQERRSEEARVCKENKVCTALNRLSVDGHPSFVASFLLLSLSFSFSLSLFSLPASLLAPLVNPAPCLLLLLLNSQQQLPMTVRNGHSQVAM